MYLKNQYASNIRLTLIHSHYFTQNHYNILVYSYKLCIIRTIFISYIHL